MQIIILGMHRSGTSAVARLVNMMGAYIGPEGSMGAPAVDNVKGFWERIDIRDLNDRVLSVLNSAWDRVAELDFVQLGDEDREAFERDARGILFNLDAHRPWTLKDPRLCLLFTLWRGLLEAPVCVHVHRSPLEVAQSLQTRNALPLLFSIALWERYTLDALRGSMGLPRVLVSYNELMSQPYETVERFYQALLTEGVQGLRLPGKSEVHAFIDPDLFHEKESQERSADFLNGQQAELYRALESGEILSWETIPDISGGAEEVLVQSAKHAQVISEKEATLNSRMQELEGVRGWLADAQKQLSRRTEELQGVKGQLGETQEQFASQAEELKGVRGWLADAQKQLSRRTEELQGVKGQLGETQEQLTSRTEELKEVRSWLADAQKQLASQTEELQGVKGQLGETQEQFASQAEELEEARGRLAEVEERYSVQTRKTGELKRRIGEAKQAVSSKSMQINELQRSLAEAKQVASTRGMENNELQRSLAEAKTAVASKNIDIDELQRSLTEARSSLASKERKIADLQRHGWEIEDRLSTREKELQAQWSSTEQSLASKEADLAFLNGELELLGNWLRQIEQSFSATLSSWRWKVGDRLVRLAERLLRRPRPVLAADQINQWLGQFHTWHKQYVERLENHRKHALLPVVQHATLPLPPVSEHEPVESGAYDLICFANIDWGARYQRPQQIAAQFARHGHRVFYVIASRHIPPTDAKGFNATLVAPNIYQIELMSEGAADRYSRPLDARNETLYRRSMEHLKQAFHIVDAVSDVHLAFWTPLVFQLRDQWGWHVLYDCMDEWEDFPNIGKPLLDMEKTLVKESDVVTVTAALLEQKWGPVNENTVLVRNGVDFEFFQEQCLPSERISGFQHPVIGFYGALADWIDFDLIRYVADHRPEWQLVLLGDVFVRDLSGLDSLSNVHLLGRRPYEEMPLYLYHFDVCLIPFKVNKVTHAVDPVKFYEFISVGKPVVAVPLEELEVYRDYLYFGRTPEEFLSQIELALQENDLELQNRRIALARANDWKDRYAQMDNAIRSRYAMVSLIIVTYKNPQLTRLCLESLLRHTTHPRYEIIVVDNDSRDGTANLLRQMQSRHPQIKVILNNENRGFAAANNQGLRVAQGDILVLLNNDTVVPRGWLGPLLRHLQDKKIGLVGPVTNFVGNEAKIEVTYHSIDDMPEFAAEYMHQHEGECFDINVLAMFCIAMRREVFQEVGFLDESFGIGMFEDDDYSYRMKEKGYRVVCAEDAFVHHFGQAAFKALLESGEYQRLWDKNQTYFESKWGQWQAHKHRAAG